ncbi:MAG: hypothetical protein Q4F24_08035 [Eubacteriales bacterium]|nr:hypothetical protein [Eubacteriales bacterium]
MEIKFEMSASGDLIAVVSEYGKEEEHYNLGKSSKTVFEFLNCPKYQDALIYTE